MLLEFDKICNRVIRIFLHRFLARISCAAPMGCCNTKASAASAPAPAPAAPATADTSLADGVEIAVVTDAELSRRGSSVHGGFRSNAVPPGGSI